LTVFVVAVFFCATLIRSALGFGEALVAVPLIAFVLPVEIAAPVAVLVSITVAAVVLAQDWRHVNVRSAMWLVGFTLPGIPLGLLLLRTVPGPIVKGSLGLIVAGFALLSLWQRDAYQLRDDRFAWLCGVSAGVLGGGERAEDADVETNLRLRGCQADERGGWPPCRGVQAGDDVQHAHGSIIGRMAARPDPDRGRRHLRWFARANGGCRRAP